MRDDTRGVFKPYIQFPMSVHTKKIRVTMNLDKEMLTKAADLSGITSKTKLVHAALTAIIHREASSRLAALAGTMPGLTVPPRRKTAVLLKGKKRKAA